MKVWVTRPAAEAAVWVRELRARGFQAEAFPLIAIGPAPDAAALAGWWQELGSLKAVMFVSTNAVRHFHAARPGGAAWPASTRAWSPGQGTRAALLEAGVPPELVDSPPPDSAQFDSESLWAQVRGQVGPGDRVLLVRGAEPDAGKDGARAGTGREWLGDRLGEAGTRVHEVVAYVRSKPKREDVFAIPDLSGGAWLFSSSQAIAHLEELLPGISFGGWTCVATHPRIAQAARDAGFGVVRESRPGIDAVAATLESIR